MIRKAKEQNVLCIGKKASKLSRHCRCIALLTVEAVVFGKVSSPAVDLCMFDGEKSLKCHSEVIL